MPDFRGIVPWRHPEKTPWLSFEDAHARDRERAHRTAHGWQTVGATGRQVIGLALGGVAIGALAWSIGGPVTAGVALGVGALLWLRGARR